MRYAFVPRFGATVGTRLRRGMCLVLLAENYSMKKAYHLLSFLNHGHIEQIKFPKIVKSRNNILILFEYFTVCSSTKSNVFPAHKK